jgi:hypothetical protein
VSAAEAEESPLLEAVTRKRLMESETERANVCKSELHCVEISGGAVITGSYKLCV